MFISVEVDLLDATKYLYADQKIINKIIMNLKFSKNFSNGLARNKSEHYQFEVLRAFSEVSPFLDGGWLWKN